MRVECNYCGRKVDGTYVSDGNFYCNPEHATLDFEKRMQRYDLKVKTKVKIGGK